MRARLLPYTKVFDFCAFVNLSNPAMIEGVHFNTDQIFLTASLTFALSLVVVTFNMTVGTMVIFVNAPDLRGP